MKHIIRWLYFKFVFKQERFAQEILAYCIPGKVKDNDFLYILAQISKIQKTDMTLLAAGEADNIRGYNLVDFSDPSGLEEVDSDIKDLNKLIGKK